MLPADLSLTFPCAAFPRRACFVCFAGFPSFVFPYRLLRFPAPFPSVTPLISISSCQFWGARLTHRSRHRHVTQTRANLHHSHRMVLHVNVGPHLQQASTARQTECTGAMVCSAGDVPFSFPPSSPSSFIERHTRFTLPSPSLTPYIARGDFSDVTSEFRRVPRWSCIFPTRRFSSNFFKVVFLVIYLKFYALCSIYVVIKYVQRVIRVHWM